MNSPAANFDELDLFVWEGKADILDRIARCMASFDVEVIRADGLPPPAPERGVAMRPSVAIISVTVIDGGGLAHATELLQGMPVIWVAAGSRERDSRTYPPEYLHVLPYDFTCAELRTMVAKLVRQLRAREVVGNARIDPPDPAHTGALRPGKPAPDGRAAVIYRPGQSY